MKKKLLIIGAGGHGKVVADIALLNGYSDIAFLDDNLVGTLCAGFPVIGKVEDEGLYSDSCDFFVAIGNAEARARIQRRLLSVVTLIHPKAIVSRRVTIGEGTVVMAGAIINSDTVIGKGCIINTGATVDHDNVIGDFVHIAVGAHLAGTVTIGEKTWIGIGACVKNNISVCEQVMVGAGAVVVKDIDKKGKYIGIPCKKIVSLKN